MKANEIPWMKINEEKNNFNVKWHNGENVAVGHHPKKYITKAKSYRSSAKKMLWMITDVCLHTCF